MSQNDQKDQKEQKDQRTNIDDISPAGEELSGDQMRLVSGGLTSGLLSDKKTHSPGTDWDADSDATDHIHDSLPVASPTLLK